MLRGAAPPTAEQAAEGLAEAIGYAHHSHFVHCAHTDSAPTGTDFASSAVRPASSLALGCPDRVAVCCRLLSLDRCPALPCLRALRIPQCRNPSSRVPLQEALCPRYPPRRRRG